MAKTTRRPIFSAYHELTGLWKDLLSKGLAEDGWQWDWTSLGTQRRSKGASNTVYTQIVCKSGGVWAGNSFLPAVHQLSKDVGESAIEVKSRVRDGDLVKPGTVVCDWAGPARTVLALERPFLNLVSYASGIATQTRKLVAIVEETALDRKLRYVPRVTSTRKTLPGYRDLGIHGVRVGGGYSHRLNLSGGVLIKENHIRAAGSIDHAVRGARSVAPHLLKVEIEVTNLREVQEAIDAEADGLLLDNFKPKEIPGALKIVSRAPYKVFVEASGGINEATIADYVQDGVHVLSIGSLTHSVKAVDLSLLVIE